MIVSATKKGTKRNGLGQVSTDEKLAWIWTQKWVSFGFLQSVRGWLDVRTTNILNCIPTQRKFYNATNYEAVQAKDTRDTKIFWDVH